MEGNKATLDKVLFIMDFMVEYYKRALKKYATNSKLCNCICTSWHAFNKYYFKTNKVTIYGAVLLLAPYWQKAYINRNWKASWRKPVIDVAQKLWVKEYKNKFNIEVIVEASNRNQEPDEYDI